MKRTKDTFVEGEYLSENKVKSEYYLSQSNSLEFHNLKRDRHMYWSSYRIEEESNLGNLVNLKEGDEDEFKYRRLSNDSDDLSDHSTIIFGSMIISNTGSIQGTLNNIKINNNSLSKLLTDGLSGTESNTIKIYEYNDKKFVEESDLIWCLMKQDYLKLFGNILLKILFCFFLLS